MGKVKVRNDKNIDDLLASIAEGRDVKPDIFEDIKNISKNGVVAESGQKSVEAEEGAEATVFECPVCGAEVDAAATQCPGCGAQFAEEEVPGEKFECPLCGAEVGADASKCPGCGVEFEEGVAEPAQEAEVRPEPGIVEEGAEEIQVVEEEKPAPRRAGEELEERPVPPGIPAIRNRVDTIRSRRPEPESLLGLDKKTLYKELPRIVSEVKPMLLSAKKMGVNIEDSKQLINDAIAHGKKKEMEKAVKLVSEAKASLEQAFIIELTGQLDSLLSEIERARGTGSEAAQVERTIREAVALLEDRRYQEVSDKIALARGEFEAKAGAYYKAREAIRTVETLVEESSVLDVDTAEARMAISRANEALKDKSWDKCEAEAVKAKELVLKQLPDCLSKEMKHARDVLLDMKVKGGDLTKPIGILKQASIHLKREEYESAVHYVKLFRQEIGLS